MISPRAALRLKSNKNRVNSAVKVLQITDLHLLSAPDQTLLGVNTEETARQVVESAQSTHWPPDLIVLTGDLTQEPRASTYRRLDRTLHGLGVPCVCLPGNHDDPRLMLEELKSENVYCSSQILTDAWQIICLDSTEPGSESGHFSEKTGEILADHLDQYPEKFALILLHHHPVPVGCAWLDTMVLDEQNKFFAILESRPQSRAVACGHIHQTLDITCGNLRVFGTPSTCFQFKPASDHFMLDDQAPGYRRLWLYPDGSIETEVYRLPELPEGLNLLSAGY
ncbi:MAG: 3',5'-cyclic-AMP phosphodiesterase [Methylococcales bacterium]